MHLPDKIFPHTLLTETMLPFVFVTKTNVWVINTTTNVMKHPTADILVSLMDLVARETIYKQTSHTYTYTTHKHYTQVFSKAFHTGNLRRTIEREVVTYGAL